MAMTEVEFRRDPSHPNRKSLVRHVGDRGYEMTRKERASVVAEAEVVLWVWYRKDRKYRSIYGYGDEPRPIAFEIGGNRLIMEFKGRVWMADGK